MLTKESDTVSLDSPAISEAEALASGGVPSPEAVRSPEILIISPAREDHEVLRGMLNDRCKIGSAFSRQEAATFLCFYRVPVIFCERDLPDGTWRDILSYAAELSSPPALIVTSRLADESLWAEVLNLGGCDVLAKPFRAREVTHALAGALRVSTSSAPRVLTAGAAGFD